MAIKSVTRISTAADGTQGNYDSFSPVFSPDGGKVAFSSSASNLVPGDTNVMTDIFVKDLGSGTIQRISTAAGGTPGNGDSYEPVFSPDGGKVAFFSSASNLVPGDTNGKRDIFVKELGSGAIERVSTAADGTEGNDDCQSPVFSPDGGKVAFESWADNLVPGDANYTVDIFIKDLGTGAIERISTADGTPGNGGGQFPAFSPDGGKVVFSSYASNLVPGDTLLLYGDIFIKNLGSGAIELISTAADGTPGSGDSGLFAVFSPDGGKVAFQSSASNLVPGDTNDPWISDIFIKNLGSGAIERVSTAADGTQGNSGSFSSPEFSPDGGRIAFDSYASNLVPGDTNGEWDIFVKDLDSGAIELISTAANGTQGNSSSYAPAFSPDGGKVAFWSGASNLVPGDTNSASDIFVVELASEPAGRITGTARSERLIGTEGNDVIDGLAGHDRLKGKDGDDVLLGGLGHDRLDGGKGDDTLIGGHGIDKLTGGQGADLFVIDAQSQVPDILFDFMPSEGDRLSLGPLIDSLGLRDESDVDALIGATRLGHHVRITIDTNGADVRGGVKTAALLLRPEVNDPHQILEYVDTDPLVLDYGDYWG